MQNDIMHMTGDLKISGAAAGVHVCLCLWCEEWGSGGGGGGGGEVYVCVSVSGVRSGEEGGRCTCVSLSLV